MCRTFEFQSVDISPGGKAQVESGSGVTKGIVATDVQLAILNYSQFDECKFRFMQQDLMGTGLFHILYLHGQLKHLSSLAPVKLNLFVHYTVTFTRDAIIQMFFSC